MADENFIACLRYAFTDGSTLAVDLSTAKDLSASKQRELVYELRLVDTRERAMRCVRRRLTFGA
jgi:hypothetical protein